MSKITPLIIGSGRSGKAIAKSLAIVNILHSDVEIVSPIFLKRGASLSDERKKYDRVLLGVATPHALHAVAIHEADRAGFNAILCEKPACVNQTQLELLQNIKTPTAILHGYRQMWGLQTIKQMLDNGELGELITIEGRYWHASAAAFAGTSTQGTPSTNWKNDVRLSGESDTYLDLATHLLDAMCFLHGSFTSEIHGWRSFINSAAAHRDTHVQIVMNVNGCRAFGSISKTVHGSPNHFEVNVIGSKRYAKWEFLNADEIYLGEGKDRTVITRRDTQIGSQQDPFHAAGWLEGYIEIAHRLINDAFYNRPSSYPSLRGNLDLLAGMFNTKWQE